VQLNPALLRKLADMANSSAGLSVDLDSALEAVQVAPGTRRPQPALSRVA
jgi:hypothetical protein